MAAISGIDDGRLVMNTTFEKTDKDLKADVLAELKYEPSVDVSDIGVLVKDGAVSLNGFVTNYGEKWNAVRAAKRVAGVRAVADDIDVKLLGTPHNDTDIAVATSHHLDWSPSVPDGTVQVTVRNGWITLDGEVEWWFQAHAAESVVEHIEGVRGVSNLIAIKPKIKGSEIQTSIRNAFERSADLDSDKVEVETSGSGVTLTGKVRNFAQKSEAERVAWAAAGVTSVDNQLEVSWLSF